MSAGIGMVAGGVSLNEMVLAGIGTMPQQNLCLDQ